MGTQKQQEKEIWLCLVKKKKQTKKKGTQKVRLHWVSSPWSQNCFNKLLRCMCTHSKELIQEVKSPCLPHDSRASFGLKTSACLEFLLSEYPKAKRKAKFWMEKTQIQNFLMVELVKPKVSTFLNNMITF